MRADGLVVLLTVEIARHDTERMTLLNSEQRNLQVTDVTAHFSVKVH